MRAVRLLSCPFCGKTPIAEPWHNRRYGVMVSCGNDICPVQPHVTGHDANDAKEKWNTRNVDHSGSFILVEVKPS